MPALEVADSLLVCASHLLRVSRHQKTISTGVTIGAVVTILFVVFVFADDFTHCCNHWRRVWSCGRFVREVTRVEDIVDGCPMLTIVEQLKMPGHLACKFQTHFILEKTPISK